MGFYSITALAKKACGIKNPLILLDTGLNVFTVQTDEIDTILEILAGDGVVVKSVNRLDKFEPVNELELPGPLIEHKSQPDLLNSDDW